MESNSIGGKIQYSEDSYRLLSKGHLDFRVEERGIINVKGNGDMLTCWVGSRQSMPSPKQNEHVKEQARKEATSNSTSVEHLYSC
jgi:hypothetical protein